jgi:uncharacterized Fe-S cluster protein YjdI
MAYNSDIQGKVMKKTYENKKIRVYWDSDKCIHSAHCLRTLPEVFDTQRRPWVDINAAEAEDISQCINNCPSGALTCEILNEEKA